MRSLRPEEVPKAVQIINAQYSASHEEIPFTADSFTDYVRTQKPTILVAEGSGRILGVILLVGWSWGDCIDLLAAVQTSVNQRIEDLLVYELEQVARVDSTYTDVEEATPSVIMSSL